MGAFAGNGQQNCVSHTNGQEHAHIHLVRRAQATLVTRESQNSYRVHSVNHCFCNLCATDADFDKFAPGDESNSRSSREGNDNISVTGRDKLINDGLGEIPDGYQEAV
jgi:hypothetical protein